MSSLLGTKLQAKEKMNHAETRRIFFSPQTHQPVNKYCFNASLLGHKNLQTSPLVYGHPNQLLSCILTACKYVTYNIQSTDLKPFIILLCSCSAQDEDHGACSETVILPFSCNSSSTYQRHLAPSGIYLDSC